MNQSTPAAAAGQGAAERSLLLPALRGAAALLVVAALFLAVRRQGAPAGGGVVPEPEAAETPAAPRPVATGPAAPPVFTPGGSALETSGGLHLLRARLAHSGSAVEILYAVADVSKASALGAARPSSVLVNPSSGKRYGLGKDIALPEGINRHSRMRAMVFANKEGQDFPPTAYRLSTARTYSTLLPNLHGEFEAGASCYILCGELQSDVILIEEEERKP